MLFAYRDVLRSPGAWAFTGAGLLLRLPLAMYPVGLVLLVSLLTGRYGQGGFLASGFIVGGAVGSPVLSRFADRVGQRAVILPAALVHVVAIAVVVGSVTAGASLVLQVAASGVLGVSCVPVGALVRARWVHGLGSSAGRLGTALSLESTLDEVSYVVGPVVATGLATGVAPAAPFVMAAGLVLVGGIVLHRQRVSTPPVRVAAGVDVQRLPRVTVVIVVVVAAIGVTLVSVDLSAIAFVGQAGRQAWTGMVLACFAAGSGTAGFVYGLLPWRSAVERRVPVVAGLFAVLPVLLLTAVDVPVLAAVMFIVGLATAPLLTTIFGVLERIAPPSRLTEGLAWVTTGLNFGAGLAAPAVGTLADAAGARAAMAIPLASSVAAGALALVAVRLVRHRGGASDITAAVAALDGRGPAQRPDHPPGDGGRRTWPNG